MPLSLQKRRHGVHHLEWPADQLPRGLEAAQHQPEDDGGLRPRVVVEAARLERRVAGNRIWAATSEL